MYGTTSQNLQLRTSKGKIYIQTSNSGEYVQIDLSLRTIIYFVTLIEDEKQIKLFHEFVPKILPPLFSAFTNDEVDAHGRELVLETLYLCLRTISWADGIDNELVDSCLSETFNSWMALFLQIIQTNPKTFFDIKRNALKCMTVIFRDFINYSRDCINMILKPAWKLLNFHLPIFTEVLGYGQLPENTDEQDGTMVYQRGYESDDDEETYGVEGMTLQLIELLTTLVSRANVQEVVKQGIVPLVTTISSYMIQPRSRERVHVGDYNHFIHDKDEDVYKARNIRNSCLDLISGLIEVFGDLAVESILFVIENLFLTTSAEASSPTKVKSTGNTQAQTVEEINIYEFSYSSSNKKHFWKKREVALFLIGSFAEDISMFRMRNPKTNFKALVENMMETEFSQAMLKSYLKGRTLWCAAQLAEIMPKDYAEINTEILNMAIKFLIEEEIVSVKLVATRCIIKFSRKVKLENIILDSSKFEKILDNLTSLLDTISFESIYLPIEAFTQFSKINEEIVAQMAPKVTPKLLKLFKSYHNEGQLGQELLNLFKLWTHYDKCRDIFVNTFIPFIMEIVENYYHSTANVDNKDLVLQPQNPIDISADKSSTTEQRVLQNIVDSSILQHVLDLLTTLLKQTKEKKAEDFEKIVEVFPKLLEYVHKSDDMFLLLHGTAALKTFIHLGSKEIKKRVKPQDVIEVAKKLLQPTTNEQAALCLGNFVIQIFDKIEPKIDTALLMNVVWKIYKSRMPSIVQSLVLIFARLINSHPAEIVELLSETSIDNRISLKIVLDKWLLQQPLFRGYYTKNMTFSALLKLFVQRDPRIETLMVIGYNPSHSNINSEVNAPFKILSLMLRYLENETSPKKGKKPIPQNYDNDEEEEKSGITPGFKMRRDLLGEGERLDTVEGDDEEDYGSDKEVNTKGGADKIEVNLDDVQDDDDNESLLGLSGKKPATANLFTIKESHDRGLADMETGSEVYMSELLAGFDMEDFDEAEEMNEEDLLELGDAMGKINLKNYIQDTLNDFIKNDKSGGEYLMYCIRQLPNDDQELAKRFLKLQK